MGQKIGTCPGQAKQMYQMKFFCFKFFRYIFFTLKKWNETERGTDCNEKISLIKNLFFCRV